MLRLVLVAFAASVVLGCSSKSDSVSSLGASAPGTSASVSAPQPTDGNAASADRVDAPSAAAFVSATDQQSAIFDGNGDFPSFPIPDGDPIPLSPSVFRTSNFSEPLPASPVWNPPGTKRVGIQAGHWQTDDVPNELRRLSPGTSAGGWAEWQINLLIAQNVKADLEDAGVEVDLLPTTIPVRYRSQAFISIHADGDVNGVFHGYKVARSGFSSVPDTDDRFVDALSQEYAAATGLPADSDAHISRRMVYYYAFNTRRYQHAIDLGTPAAIIETGFLTNNGDRAFLTGRPDLVGQGIANGILRFLALDIGAQSTP